MPGAAVRTDTLGQPGHGEAPQQQEWTHEGRGGGVAASDTEARTFSDTSTAYLRASAFDFDDGLEDSLQTTLETVNSRDDGDEGAIDDMLSRGQRMQSLSAGLVSGDAGGEGGGGEAERAVSEGVPPEHASHASLKEQLRLARADRALALGTQINVSTQGAEDAVYAGWKRKRIGGNQHTVEDVRGGGSSRVVKLKGLEHWSIVGGVMYGRSSPFTLEELLSQARQRDAAAATGAPAPSAEVARLLKAGAADPALRMTASVYEPDDNAGYEWDHELEPDEPEPASLDVVASEVEPEPEPEPEPELEARAAAAAAAAGAAGAAGARAGDDGASDGGAAAIPDPGVRVHAELQLQQLLQHHMTMHSAAVAAADSGGPVAGAELLSAHFAAHESKLTPAAADESQEAKKGRIQVTIPTLGS